MRDRFHGLSNYNSTSESFRQSQQKLPANPRPCGGQAIAGTEQGVRSHDRHPSIRVTQHAGHLTSGQGSRRSVHSCTAARDRPFRKWFLTPFSDTKTVVEKSASFPSPQSPLLVSFHAVWLDTLLPTPSSVAHCPKAPLHACLAEGGAKSPRVNILSFDDSLFTDSACCRGRVYPWGSARTRVISFPARSGLR